MMKISHKLTQLGLLVCLAFTFGCGDITELEIKQVLVKRPAVVEPVAVLSMSPMQNWYPDAMAMLKKQKLRPFSKNELKFMLTAVDKTKPAASMMYVDDGTPEVVWFVPVTDYRMFLAGLDWRFGLKEAAASSFRYGPYKIYVKNIDDYAVLGSSIEGINNCEKFPTEYTDNLPEDFDFAFMLNTDIVHKKEKNNIVRAIKRSLGDSFVELAKENSLFTFGLNLDSTADVGLQAKITPVPDDTSQIEESLSRLFSKHGLETTTEVKEDRLVVDVSLPALKTNEAWVKVKPVLSNAFAIHLNVLAIRAARSDQRFVEESGDSSLFLPQGSG